MNKLLILFLCLLYTALLTASGDKGFNQLVFNARLYYYDLQEDGVSKLFDTKLYMIPGNKAQSEWSGSKDIRYSLFVKGDIIMVDEVKKIIRAELSLNLEGRFSLKIEESLFLYRGETRKMTLFSNDSGYLVLELDAVFSCYECPSAFDSEYMTRNREKSWPVNVKVSSSKAVVADKTVVIRTDRSGNLNLSNGPERIMFEIEPQEREEHLELRVRVWRIKEERGVRTTYNHTYDLMLSPDEKESITVDGDDPLNITFELAQDSST